MTAILVLIHLSVPIIHQRPMRDMATCEDAAKVYNENINVRLGKLKIAYHCAWVGAGWNRRQ